MSAVWKFDFTFNFGPIGLIKNRNLNECGIVVALFCLIFFYIYKVDTNKDTKIIILNILKVIEYIFFFLANFLIVKLLF